MEASIGNDMSHSAAGDYSPDNSLVTSSKQGQSKNSYTKGTPKTKRRSKNDAQGRNFKCNLWDKSYLSYPALYTHRKQKHPTPPDAMTPQQSMQSASRGRPRKNDKINPCTEKYLEGDDKKATDKPANLIRGYEDALKEFFNAKITLDNKLFEHQLDLSNNPLYKAITDFSKKDLSEVSKESVSSGDQAFSAYLKYCSQKVNPEFFNTVCKFIIFYREAFNQYGPDKYSSDDSTKEWEKDFFGVLHKKLYSKGFSELANAEYLPDVSNELYIFFQFHYKKLGLTKEVVKELTLNFTTWLHKKGLTTARVMV